MKKECGFHFVPRKKGKGIGVKLLKLPEHKMQEVREARLGREFAEKFNTKPVVEWRAGLDDLACRWEAQRLRNAGDVEVCSLVSPRTEVSELLGVKTEQGDVLRVLLKDMPEPSDSTSLEQVLQFKQDPDSRDKMFAFHRWVGRMVSKGLPPKEIAEELEWLSHEYKQHMRLHEMKVNKGILEIVLTTAAEVAEDLVKIRWSKLSKLLFSMSHRKIDLLESELKAPGREIAYVLKCSRTFHK